MLNTTLFDIILEKNNCTANRSNNSSTHDDVCIPSVKGNNHTKRLHMQFVFRLFKLPLVTCLFAFSNLLSIYCFRSINCVNGF